MILGKKKKPMNVYKPKCSLCGKNLTGGESILSGPGKTVIISNRSPEKVISDYSLYHGSICFKCKQIFCVKCLGERVDCCPVCGGETKPCYHKYLIELSAMK